VAFVTALYFVVVVVVIAVVECAVLSTFAKL
jgi:hypothetical protein